MNTIFYHPSIRGLLSLWLLFICLALVWAMMKLLQQKRFRMLIPTLFFFVGCDIYWQYLNAYSFYVPELGNKENFKIDYAPIWLIVLINVVLTAAVILLTVHLFRWQKSHISAVSIKESFDTIPSGICFYKDGGRTYLVNEAMENIIRRVERSSGVSFLRKASRRAPPTGRLFQRETVITLLHALSIRINSSASLKSSLRILPMNWKEIDSLKKKRKSWKG